MNSLTNMNKRIGVMLYWCSERIPVNRWNWLAWRLDALACRLITGANPWWMAEVKPIVFNKIGSEAAARE